MNTFSNNLLSSVNRISTKFNPVMKLFDDLLEKVTPKITAQACSGYYCTTVCGSCCSNCSGDYKSITYARYTQLTNCNGSNCYVNLGCTYC